MAVAHGKAAFWVTDFPKVKFSVAGKFPWIHQPEQKNYPWQFPKKALLVNKNLMRLNQSREIETYQKKKARVVYVLSPSWRQTGLRNLSRILSASVNVFLYFTISHKFKRPSKHS